MSEWVISRRKREVKAEWRIDDRHVVVLSVFHHKDSRCFTASLRQEEDLGDGSRRWSPFDRATNAALGRESVARYSDRAIGEFFNRMLLDVERRRKAGEFVLIFTAQTDSESEAA